MNIPEHIAIIMDGNRRWAKQKGLPIKLGHKNGAEVLRKIVEYSKEIGVKFLTVYAFSTENWKRPADEVEGIMNLLRDYLKDAENFKDENIKVKFIGPQISQELNPTAFLYINILYRRIIERCDICRSARKHQLSSVPNIDVVTARISVQYIECTIRDIYRERIPIIFA